MFEYAGEGEREQSDIELKKLTIDWASLKTGWGMLAQGNSDFAWAEVAGTSIQRPGEDYKPAFQVDVWLAAADGAPSDCWVHWRSIGQMNRNAIQGLQRDVMKGAKDNAGKVVVASVKEIVKSGKNNNHMPVLTVDSWVDAPSKPEEIRGWLDWKSNLKRWRCAAPAGGDAGAGAGADEIF